jgi:hypothetical protein
MIRNRGLALLLAVLATGLGPVGSGVAEEKPGALVGTGLSGMPPELLSAVLGADGSKVVYKVSELPAEVLALSGMSVRTVADAEKPYNQTDVVMRDQETWPFERLVWAIRAGPYYLVNREVGGDVSNAGVTAYRIGADGAGRFAWGAITMTFGQAGGLSTHRTFEDFRKALGEGMVRGSTGNCASWLSAPQEALKTMLLPAHGDTAGDLARLPQGVRTMVERRLIADGRHHLKWATPVDGGYIVQIAPTSEGKGRIAVIRTPVRRSTDLLWLGAPGQFEDHRAFQRKLRSTMSVEVEQAILTGQCQTLQRGWSRPGSSPIIAPMAG